MRCAMIIAAFCLVDGTALCEDAPARRSPVKAEFTSKTDDRKISVRINLTIEGDWYVLANPVGDPRFEAEQVQVQIPRSEKLKQVAITYPKGESMKVDGLGDINVYRGAAIIQVEITRMPQDETAVEIELFLRPHNNRLGVCGRPELIKHKVR